MQAVSLKTYANGGNKEVLRFLTEKGSVLDVGCGAGDNAKILKAFGFTVDGITISANEVKEASLYLENTYLHNLEKGLPSGVMDKQYDYIICSHVLEHICYPEQLLNNMKQVLSDGGRIIIALPNLMHYASRWKLMKGQFQYQESGIWDNTHFRWYTFASARKLLEEAGFHVIEQSVSGKLPFYSFFARFLPASWEQRCYAALAKISPGLFGYQLIYVATK